MKLLETDRDFSPDALARVWPGTRRWMRNWSFLLLVPVISQLCATLWVPESAIQSNGWAAIMIETSSAYLPALENYAPGAPELYRHAFGMLVGFWTGLLAFLSFFVLSSARWMLHVVRRLMETSYRKGKPVKVNRSLLTLAWPIVILLWVLVIGGAGTQAVILDQEDLSRAERIVRFLFDVPWLFALVHGGGWGMLALFLRMFFLLAGNWAYAHLVHDWLVFQDGHRVAGKAE